MRVLLSPAPATCCFRRLAESTTRNPIELKSGRAQPAISKNKLDASTKSEAYSGGEISCSRLQLQSAFSRILGPISTPYIATLRAVCRQPLESVETMHPYEA